MTTIPLESLFYLKIKAFIPSDKDIECKIEDFEIRQIHNNAIAFGGINVILVGDLAQLPPITGQLVFHANIWSLFYPLFLTTLQRQNSDRTFYRVLKEVRSGNISPETWNILQQRHSEFVSQPTVDTTLNTTHIVGFKETA
jgi:hypothetical protein